MTEEEQRQQKAMLLLEFQEAESRLANLREKAGRIGRSILEVGHWLASMSAERGPDINRSENKKTDEHIRANLEIYRKAFDFQRAIELMDEITKAESNLSDLKTRKSELGLK